ncbi:MAG: fibronectin type III domain-containing protein, partial [Paludibacteraceae bacterium]
NYLPYLSTAQDHTESAYVPASLLLKGTSLSSNSWNTSYAMMPAMPIDLTQLMLTFWAQSNDKNLKLVVGVANTQTNDMATGLQLSGAGNVTPVDTLTFNASGEWEQKAVSFLDYVGTGKYITFWLVSATATPNVYIDDLHIDYSPTCYYVRNLAATATSTTQLHITWAEMLRANAWKIKVSSTEIDPSTEDGDIVANERLTTTEYTANGLIGNTTYYVYVSPDCGDYWTSTTCTTLYAVKVPYYNDFSTEPTGTGKMPNYWIVGNAGGSTNNTYKPYVYTTAWSANTGYTIPAEVTKPSLYFNGGTTSTGTSANNKPFAVMPELSNAQVKDVTLSFWGHTNQTNAAYGRILRIGVLTDPTDISTLTEVTTVRLQNYKVSEFFTVNMSSYTGNGKYIVFYSDTTGKANYFMMDNLSISLSASPQRVTDVALDTVTTTTATLLWEENGTATNWEVLLFEGATANPDEDSPLSTFTASTNPTQELTGLTHSTQYTVYVRAVQGTEKGAWSMPLTFWTETGTWALPFYENFDSYKTGGTTTNTLPPYYIVNHSSASNFPYVRSYSGAAVAHESKSNNFYMTAGSGKVSQLEFPPFNVPVNQLQIELEACCYSSYFGNQSTTYFGVVTADGTFHKVAERQVSAKAWEPWLVDFSSYEGEDGRIAIRLDYAATGLAKTLYVFIENVQISAIPQCKKVQTISARAITQTGATVTWEAAGDETAWNLKVSSTELADPATATADMFDGAVNTAKQMLTNLSADTEYYVYVQSTNASKDCVGEWSQAFSFHTLCDAVVRPYSENFDEMDKGIIPACYTLSGKVTDATAAATGQSTGATSQALKLSQVDKANTNYCAFPLV